jgi:hypothetical protein
MEYYILLEHWASLVRKFKDEEAPNGYDAGKLSDVLLDYIRYDTNGLRRFRQYNLFTQKRGEEFEKMFDFVERSELSVDMARRFIEDDERWKTLLEVADS